MLGTCGTAIPRQFGIFQDTHILFNTAKMANNFHVISSDHTTTQNPYAYASSQFHENSIVSPIPTYLHKQISSNRIETGRSLPWEY